MKDARPKNVQSSEATRNTTSFDVDLYYVVNSRNELVQTEWNTGGKSDL